MRVRRGQVFPIFFSALAMAVATLGSAWLARQASSLAHASVVLLVAVSLLATASLTPTSTFSRPALLGAGAILAACLTIPLALVVDPASWLRQVPALLGTVWLWLYCLGLPYPRARAWCVSTPALLAAATLLGGGVVASALW